MRFPGQEISAHSIMTRRPRACLDSTSTLRQRRDIDGGAGRDRHELARADIPLALAQKLMRHSTPALTANVYTRLELHDARAAVARLEGERGEIAGGEGRKPVRMYPQLPNGSSKARLKKAGTIRSENAPQTTRNSSI